jgi:hypothetical protein
MGENEFCDYSTATSKNPDEDPAYNAGTCRANEPGCGEIGKKCCVFTGGAASGIKCGAYPGSPGLKGYCADPPGWKGPGKPSESQQICTACPAKVDESMKDSNPDMYSRCRKM